MLQSLVLLTPIFERRGIAFAAVFCLKRNCVVSPHIHQDCSRNFVWLRPVVEAYPKVAPSPFFMTDVYLEVDKRLGGKLLLLAPENGKIPFTSMTEKVEIAAAEVGKLRKLYSTLRYLYRNGSREFALETFFGNLTCKVIGKLSKSCGLFSANSTST